MSNTIWKAPQEVVDFLEEVKNQHHQERLVSASVAVSFDDSKPFVQNKLNLGKLLKTPKMYKQWFKKPCDFHLIVPMDLWHSILKNSKERAAYLDLMLTRCSVEYLPEEVEENGKKKKLKDEWGRVQFSDLAKTDDDGNPKWKVLPLDIEVFTKNVSRYGLWYDQLVAFANACESSPRVQNG